MCCAQTAPPPIHLRVRLSPELARDDASGRLIVFLSSQKEPRKELSQEEGKEAKSVWITSQEVRLSPGQEIEIGPNAPAFPAPLNTAPPGDYQAMALLDVNHHYAYNGAHPGDLRSVVVPLPGFTPAGGTVALTLTQRYPEEPIKPLPGTELVDFVSPSLSAFWGRPIHMRGLVVLPPGYESSLTRHYPTVYWTHGFGAELRYFPRVAASYQRLMSEGKLPEMIYVLLDESCSGGTHEFADSVNNGPWGKALTSELIPHLEKTYRMDARPSGRLLTGHSSGGWAVLWLQVTYPQVFGGSWPTSPDPSDFRNFTGPDLRKATNIYRKPDGTPYQLVRMNGEEVMSFEEYARQEAVLGDYGGQISSFDWVFSPRGGDGRPAPLFDRDTGIINRAVAEAWEKYDIAEIVRKNAARLKPLLDGKIHLTVGTADTFHLDESARLLEQTFKEAGIRADFTFLAGRSHFDLYRDGLTEQIGREMAAVARPGEKVAAKPAAKAPASQGNGTPARP
ncbi:MAG TPA: alpha/beta hydrolase-fold protein [Terriglobales bacterium]|nr:alpha/beta hydrolase-fold protein [Terriglobales bacterium]